MGSGMSRVVLMCGPAGAGKSTVARRLEEDGMVRLSFDQEAWDRGIRSMPLSPELREQIEGDKNPSATMAEINGVALTTAHRVGSPMLALAGCSLRGAAGRLVDSPTHRSASEGAIVG